MSKLRHKDMNKLMRKLHEIYRECISLCDQVYYIKNDMN